MINFPGMGSYERCYDEREVCDRDWKPYKPRRKRYFGEKIVSEKGLEEYRPPEIVSKPRKKPG